MLSEFAGDHEQSRVWKHEASHERGMELAKEGFVYALESLEDAYMTYCSECEDGHDEIEYIIRQVEGLCDGHV